MSTDKYTAKARELFDRWGWALPQIDELATALRDAAAAGAAAEREACAKIVDDLHADELWDVHGYAERYILKSHVRNLALRIRARSGTERSGT